MTLKITALLVTLVALFTLACSDGPVKKRSGRSYEAQQERAKEAHKDLKSQ